MSQDDRKIADNVECLQHTGWPQAYCGLQRNGKSRQMVRNRRTGGLNRGRFGRFSLPFEKRRESAWPDGLGQDMPRAVQISFFHPLQVVFGNENDDCRSGAHTANLVEGPRSLKLVGFEVDNAKIDDARAQKRFGL